MTDPIKLLEQPDRPIRPSLQFEHTLADQLHTVLNQPRSPDLFPPLHKPVDSGDQQVLAPEPASTRRQGLLTAIGSFAVVVAAILTAAWLVRAQSDIDQPTPSGGTGVTGNTTATSEAAAPPSGDPAATTAPTPTTQPLAGWQFVELPIEHLEGSTYVLGGENLLVWGGQVDREPDIRNDGWILSLTGHLTPVTAAPIEPRVETSGVWTGSEFIVFGGRPVDGSQSAPAFVDGAVLDPETGSWTSISPAPLQPGTRTAAAWTGSRLVVWVAPPELDAVPDERAGQFAVYDPESGGWAVLASPDVTLADATLFATERRLTVIGGPNMGSQMFAEGYLVAVEYDFDAGRWTTPYEFAFTLQGSATRTENGTLLAVTAEGQVGEFHGDSWISRGSVPPSLAYPVKVTAGGGETYILGDETYRVVDGEQTERILGYRPVASDYIGASVASDRGTLVVLSPAVDEQGLHVGPVTLSIYDPAR